MLFLKKIHALTGGPSEAASRVSCKKLADILLESKLLPEKSASLSPVELEKKLKKCCEAFGRDVRCFVYVADMDKRKQLERFLKTKGISPNLNYAPSLPVVEIPVSYFKAWHWDE